jgi:hypothetical protein
MWLKRTIYLSCSGKDNLNQCSISSFTIYTLVYFHEVGPTIFPCKGGGALFLGANVDMHMSHQSLVELVPDLVFWWLAIISIHEQVCLMQTYIKFTRMQSIKDYIHASCSNIHSLCITLLMGIAWSHHLLV